VPFEKCGHHGSAVGPAVVLRRVGFWVCVFASLSLGALVTAGGAAAGLHPDPPKLPERAPPPPPPAPVAAPDPVPAAPPAAVAPVVPEPSRAAPTASRAAAQARAIAAARAARGRAREQLRLKERLATQPVPPVRTPTAARRTPAVAYAISSSSSRTSTLRALALPLLVGLLLLGVVLGPTESLPWPQPARVLLDRRGEITFAGLGILASCFAVALLLLLVS
jgi:hypothetical protein